MKVIRYLLLLLCIALSFVSKAYTPTTVKDEFQVYSLGKSLMVYEDKSGNESLQQVISKSKFTLCKEDVPNFGISKSAFWLKFSIQNTTPKSQLLLLIENPIIDEIEYYQVKDNKTVNQFELGDTHAFNKRQIANANYVFPISTDSNNLITVYIKVKSNDQLQLPVFIGTEQAIYQQLLLRDLLFGIYSGIILIMVLYNLFVYVSVKDSSYIYYVLFIVFVGLSQATLQGFGFRFLWPNQSWFSVNSTIIIPVFSGITTGLFMKKFLQTALYAPKLDKGIDVFIGGYVLALLVCLAGFNHEALQLLHLQGAIGSFYALYVGYCIHKKGIRSGRFFLIANSIFLLAVVVFVLRNVNVVPYNTFTSVILELGSAFQVSLLSFALADKINTLKREKELSQEQALVASLENEKLVREQNVMLEQKVNERTEELQQTNSELQSTLNQLKDTQSQLVDAEKMASLGQLTAGIAHEINNPINFVSSNIKPLQMDIDDLFSVIAKYEELDLSSNAEEKLKEIDQFKKKIDLEYVGSEIKLLLQGIQDGAVRTAEIVKGLRSFSRLDESEMKKIDVHECIDSTLIILKHVIPSFITIKKEYNADKQIECYPGKLNQALLNLFNNAIQAVVQTQNETNHSITIKTDCQGDFIGLSISDTGIGMPESIRERIFEPFFTTKEVGQGTGLGLSIVYKIIEKHQGKIEVQSIQGVGTTFTLLLPLQLKNEQIYVADEVFQA
ncbi:7TM diverse intracellular signaling domain-containing protein [Solitalea lacus]|uniref:sensor histidine kinase n=1 Tax=Solitalea lacus TaxID=2911172 RepID=UPI001EDAC7A0|nr:7TM diverse intracellular signaling domain-containing protein [Solitalea lacus]UKJ09000.1 sensor histidine kinase [Solitalea lacus]